LFTSAWLEFAIMMVILAAILGQETLLTLSSLLVITLPLAWVWQRLAFLGVTYQRTLNETRVFEGETVQLTLRVTNRKWLPLAWLRVNDRIPLATAPLEKPLSPSHIPLSGTLESRASLLWNERARWDYHIPCNKRGYFALGPAQISTGDLFGLFERTLDLSHIDRLIVYPRIHAIEEWGLPPKEPFGDARTRLHVMQDPTRIRGLRDYHPEDAPKHIHWRATARHNALKVKQYDPTINFNWVFFLNLATYEQAWQGVDSERAERAIRLTASLANFAALQKYAFGLVANGTFPDSDQRLRVLPGRDPEQLRNVLEALAALSYYIASPIEHLLRRESATLPWGATLIVITPLVTENMLAEILRLHDVGRRIALVSLDDTWEPRPLPGVLVYRAHDPAQGLVPVDARASTQASNLDSMLQRVSNTSAPSDV
jgi:uncharacterized protein (DUF58 family)